MYVKDYMLNNVCTVKEDLTVAEAVRFMVKKKTNSLIVVDDSGKPIGMISSYGLIKEVVPEYLKDDPVSSNFDAEGTFDKYAEKIKDKKISEIMHKNFHVIGKDDAMIEAAAYSIHDERRMLPVVDKQTGRVAGAITRTSIKNALYNVLFKDDPIDPSLDADKYCQTA